jgi:uncharacterized Zn finger protein (UPF0148 family)
MAATALESAWRCAYCGTPIIRPETLVDVAGTLYCSPNCELMSRNPEIARRARRGGGLVLACNQCGTPIFLPEIMVHEGTRSYCGPNCAAVAHARRASDQPASRPALA